MESSILSAADIQDAFKMLPGLTVSQLARDTGLNRSHVSQAVNGHVFNRKVADKVMEYLEKDLAVKNRIEAIKQKTA